MLLKFFCNELVGMVCNCGKNKIVNAQQNEPDPSKWGPILWKYLHTLSENIGISGSTITDADQAQYMDTLITNLHLIIPCPECQQHSASYIASNPFPKIKDLKGDILRSTVRNWLFTFHNSVRNTKGQSIIINTSEECAATYTGKISRDEYAVFIQHVSYAMQKGWIKIENWRKWYSNSERMRIITGIIV
jgi:hypothetical protein